MDDETIERLVTYTTIAWRILHSANPEEHTLSHLSSLLYQLDDEIDLGMDIDQWVFNTDVVVSTYGSFYGLP